MCLQEFKDMAGHWVNQLKSYLYMFGMNEQTRQELLFVIGFQEDTMPFRYFGIPLSSKRHQISDYSLLLDSLVKRINSWPWKTLSYA